jgi:LmbE family N-acetylglucosaminyl deacetylase
VRYYDDIPERALAVFAHPDDPETACAGTLARWLAEGTEVHLVVCAVGDKGSLDPDIKPASLAQTRRSEVAAASEELGLTSHEILGFLDGDIDNSAELREMLVTRIRNLRPEVVIAPDPTAVFFGETYVNHRDHRELGWAVLDAVAPASSSPHYFPGAGPPHQVTAMLLAGTLSPDIWVDISKSLEPKIRAVIAHASQIGEDPNMVAELLRERAESAGRRAGCRFAEEYRLLQLAG